MATLDQVVHHQFHAGGVVAVDRVGPGQALGPGADDDHGQVADDLGQPGPVGDRPDHQEAVDA